MSLLAYTRERIQTALRAISLGRRLRELLYLANNQIQLGNRIAGVTDTLTRQANDLCQLQSNSLRWLEAIHAEQASHRAFTEKLLTTALDIQIRRLLEDDRYSDPKGLSRFEFRVYSQSGEDGIIEEIFKRIGTTNKIFVEFGAGHGLENNSAVLLVKGWTGLWIEADKRCLEIIDEKFASKLRTGQLALRRSFVTAENIEDILDEEKVPSEFDLMSIDIDGNDYWVWKAIKRYKPRAVVVEYNAAFRDNIEWIRKYDPTATWDGTSYQGASLKSLEKLGRTKGYRLVGCSLSGVNAFFVRDDLAQDRFLEPYTSERHYEPARYLLIYQRSGHPPGFGEYCTDEPETT